MLRATASFLAAARSAVRKHKSVASTRGRKASKAAVRRTVQRGSRASSKQKVSITTQLSAQKRFMALIKQAQKERTKRYRAAIKAAVRQVKKGSPHNTNSTTVKLYDSRRKLVGREVANMKREMSRHKALTAAQQKSLAKKATKQRPSATVKHARTGKRQLKMKKRQTKGARRGGSPGEKAAMAAFHKNITSLKAKRNKEIQELVKSIKSAVKKAKDVTSPGTPAAATPEKNAANFVTPKAPKPPAASKEKKLKPTVTKTHHAQRTRETATSGAAAAAASDALLLEIERSKAVRKAEIEKLIAAATTQAASAAIQSPPVLAEVQNVDTPSVTISPPRPASSTRAAPVSAPKPARTQTRKAAAAAPVNRDVVQASHDVTEKARSEFYQKMAAERERKLSQVRAFHFQPAARVGVISQGVAASAPGALSSRGQAVTPGFLRL